MSVYLEVPVAVSGHVLRLPLSQGQVLEGPFVWRQGSSLSVDRGGKSCRRECTFSTRDRHSNAESIFCQIRNEIPVGMLQLEIASKKVPSIIVEGGAGL